MLALITNGRLVLWRRIGRRLTYWREVRGDAEKLDRALRSAQELTELARRAGGWSNALGLGFDAPKPRHLVKVSTGVLLQDDLDRGLRNV
jgi:hypothetical protein